jgi:hypothetical protein
MNTIKKLGLLKFIAIFFCFNARVSNAMYNAMYIEKLKREKIEINGELDKLIHQSPAPEDFRDRLDLLRGKMLNIISKINEAEIKKRLEVGKSTEEIEKN